MTHEGPVLPGLSPAHWDADGATGGSWDEAPAQGHEERCEMFSLDDALEARTSPGGLVDGAYCPPPTDADALTAHQRAQPVLRDYDPGVTPWYDGRWELPSPLTPPTDGG